MRASKHLISLLFLAATTSCSTPETPAENQETGLTGTPIHQGKPDESTPTGDTETEDEPEDSGSPEDSQSEPAAPSFEDCFTDTLGTSPGPDYGQFSPTLGHHCKGTNHQNIENIQRVVFLGDSVTVGTLPTPDSQFYRSVLAKKLAQQFGLKAPDWSWEAVNLFEGTTLVQESGDFASCAKWGARADDLLEDNDQLLDCFPAAKRHLNTLVILTVGGNDLSSITQGFIEGKSTADLWSQTQGFMTLVDEAVQWIKAENRFPNGVSVIFSNLYEFTDGTGDVTSCPVAELAGFGAAVDDPALEEMVIWSMEQFMRIAVETQSDMLFLLESFCGHGFNHDDPNGRCYRGPNAENWFDLTCIHPNPTGHQEIAQLFFEVVKE
jgi:lysophospholipase L1-like esterase